MWSVVTGNYITFNHKYSHNFILCSLLTLLTNTINTTTKTTTTILLLFGHVIRVLNFYSFWLVEDIVVKQESLSFPKKDRKYKQTNLYACSYFTPYNKVSYDPGRRHIVEKTTSFFFCFIFLWEILYLFSILIAGLCSMKYSLLKLEKRNILFIFSQHSNYYLLQIFILYKTKSPSFYYSMFENFSLQTRLLEDASLLCNSWSTRQNVSELYLFCRYSFLVFFVLSKQYNLSQSLIY